MNPPAKIGTTSYGFRYLLLDERRAPPLVSIVEKTSEAGLEVLQICENARPLKSAGAGWREVVRVAGGLGVELHVGCMTLDPEVMSRYLELAADLPDSDTLRIVLENEDGAPPARDDIVRFLDAAAPRLEASRMKLAIENHFHIPCRTLSEIVRSYPEDLVVFCIDTANSLRSFEPVDQVFDLLGSRAAYYHLKDFKIKGSNVGFAVGGAPLGEGHLDLQDTLGRIYERHPHPFIFLENWVPSVGDWDRDVAADAQWLSRSLTNLAAALGRNTVPAATS